MGIVEWFRSFSRSPTMTINVLGEEELSTIDFFARKLAFQTAVNLISNSISKCEFKTYMANKEVKQREHYLWNVEPNVNQNSSEFIHKFISKLYYCNECLIIEQNGQLLIADSFSKKEYALYGHQFSQVAVGDFSFDKTFTMQDVLYFKLANDNVKRLIDGMFDSYGKLIEYSQKSYLKSRGNKGTLAIGTQAQNHPDFKKNIEKLFTSDFKKFFDSDSGVLPVYEGTKYEELGSKAYSSETTRDIKALIDDVYDFTARATGIPPALLKGDIADVENAVDRYLTFCIDPLADLVGEEINRKRNGYSGVSKGDYLRVDTTAIKHFDVLSMATNIDKLISSSVFCVNDIKKLTGDEIIDEPWAWKHYITKNYTDVEKLEALEGGEKT